MIELGALEHETSVLNYQGPAYHRAAFDELTQFSEAQYEYIVNSRLRRLVDFPIPVGARGASNPGGPGHIWVKNRFITTEAIEAINSLESTAPTPRGMKFEAERGRIFVPARIADNPYLNIEEYRESLSEFSDPVMRERLMNGDWSIIADGKILSSWLRYFGLNGQIISLEDQDGQQFAVCDERECRRFATIDTAGTSEDVAREQRGHSASWSVMQIWDKLPNRFGNKICLRHVWRKRVGFTDLLDGIRETYARWQPSKVIIEDKHFGPAVATMLRNAMPITTISPGQKDKLERATDLLNMLSRGEVFLPKFDNDWRPTLESEWLSWQGNKDETADQIDTAAYAAWEAKEGNEVWGGVITVPRR